MFPVNNSRGPSPSVFQSSANPTQPSMTFTGAAILVVPLIIEALQFYGIVATHTEIVDLFQLSEAAIGAIFIALGSIRKVINAVRALL